MAEVVSQGFACDTTSGYGGATTKLEWKEVDTV